MMFKLDLQLFASKKGVGSTKNGRDSHSKRLGAKLSAAKAANTKDMMVPITNDVIARQIETKTSNRILGMSDASNTNILEITSPILVNRFKNFVKSKFNK